MIGSIVEQVFNKFYVLLKLNLYFLVLTAIGGVAFGIGPAYCSILTLYKETGWDTNNKSFKKAWSYYKNSFWKANRLAVFFIGLIILLMINLLIAVQEKGLLFFSITLIIFVCLIALIFIFNYALQIEINYELSWRENVLLSITILFSNLKELALQVGGLILLAFIFIKLPALILFCAFSSMIIWFDFTLEKRLTWINEALVTNE
ncbi:DUF624 domain-containing protein [Enterococcus diestrammenae]|uniref:DUF624 domain-containing protein n=1 Tax=Enterococcus diestrammenae TaxID=1155073 RepID=UPI0019599FB4